MLRLPRAALTGPFACALLTLTLSAAAGAHSGFGAVQTTDITGTRTDQNLYPRFTDVYLDGGGLGRGNILDAGYYAYAITDTSKKSLVTSIGSFHRTPAQGGVESTLFNIMTGEASPYALPLDQGGSGVRLIDAPTSNGEYKLMVWQLRTVGAGSNRPGAGIPGDMGGVGDMGDMGGQPPATPATLDDLAGYAWKSDNFRVLDAPSNAAIPEPGTMSLLALGLVPMVGINRRRHR